jgi:hypothetical protein
MSNASSVFGFSGNGTGRNQFATLALASTTETIFTINTDSGTPVNYFLVAPSGGSIYGAQQGLDINANPAVIDRSAYIWGLPSGDSNDQFTSSAWDGREFKIRACGKGNAGANAAQTVQVNLYQGTSATLGSDHALATTGTALAAVAGGAFNFSVEARLLWDATSQILSGSYTANIAFGTVSQFTTTTVVTNVVTSVTPALLSFLATIKMGNGAASTAFLTEFVLDRI